MKGHSLADCRLAEALLSRLQPRAPPSTLGGAGAGAAAALGAAVGSASGGGGGGDPEPLISQCQAADIEALAPSELLEMVAWSAAISSMSAAVGVVGGADADAGAARRRMPAARERERERARGRGGTMGPPAPAQGRGAPSPDDPLSGEAGQDLVVVRRGGPGGDGTSGPAGVTGTHSFGALASGPATIPYHPSDRPLNVAEVHVGPFGFGATSTLPDNGGAGGGGRTSAARSVGGLSGPGRRSGAGSWQGAGGGGSGGGGGTGSRPHSRSRRAAGGTRRHRGALCHEQRRDVRSKLHERLLAGSMDAEWVSATHGAWRKCMQRIMADARARRIAAAAEAEAAARAVASGGTTPLGPLTPAGRGSGTPHAAASPAARASPLRRAGSSAAAATAAAAAGPSTSTAPPVGGGHGRGAGARKDPSKSSAALVEMLLNLAADWCAAQRCVTVGTTSILRQVGGWSQAGGRAGGAGMGQARGARGVASHPGAETPCGPHFFLPHALSCPAA
jgi:hypothetical protein